MKKAFTLKVLVYILILLNAVFCVSSVLSHRDTAALTAIPTSEDIRLELPVTAMEVPTEPESIQLPDFTEDVLLCSPVAKEVFDGTLTVDDAVKAGEDPYRPFSFEYFLPNSSGKLLLSENTDFSDPKEYVLKQEETVLTIDNLKTDADYFYKVFAEGEEFSGSFRTASSTRFVSMPGAVNTRDIGGYVNQDGIKVKQGLLIRGSEIDGLCETSYFLQDEYLQDVMQTFRFVCDFDLREDEIFVGDYQSRLGEDVTHRFRKAPAYGSVFHDYYTQRLRQIFIDLADPENYPMYLHCTYGADRTGTIVFLLQGILNMSEEDMYREYQLTGLMRQEQRDTTGLDVIVNGLAACPGDTLQEKIESFLTREIGVRQPHIQSIREIFLEQPAPDQN